MNQANTRLLKTGIWGVVVGAVLTMIIGFAWGGWVSGSTSMNLGQEMAREAVIERLTPICVAQFNLDPNKVEKLKELTETDSWKRGQYVKDQGWATMPFEKEPDGRVADNCSQLIMKINNQ